jgi:zona occludens toxin
LPKRHLIYPKEVYGFYKRASVHTAQRNPAKTILAIIALPLLAIGIGYVAHQHLNGTRPDIKNEPLKAQQSATGMIGAEATVNRPTPASTFSSQTGKGLVVEKTSPKTRITGNTLKHNAITHSVASSSTPAACIRSAHKCDCYTGQGIKLDTPTAMCVDIVMAGSLKEYWHGDRDQPPQSMPASRPLENHYSSISITNSLRASKQAAIAMQSHGGFSTPARSDQSTSSSQSGS